MIYLIYLSEVCKICIKTETQLWCEIGNSVETQTTVFGAEVWYCYLPWCRLCGGSGAVSLGDYVCIDCRSVLSFHVDLTGGVIGLLATRLVQPSPQPFLLCCSCC